MPPDSRGPLTAVLLHELRSGPHRLPPIALPEPEDPLADEDLHLALYVLYELHYRGLDGVDGAGNGSRRCWSCARELEASSRRRSTGVGPPRRAAGPPGRWTSRCAGSRSRRGPSLSRLPRARATLTSSASSPSTARPISSRRPIRTAGRSRGCRGRPKAAIVEVQADEYGDGAPERIHAELFALAMERARPGPDLRRVPRPDPGRDAGHREPDVAVRAAPALARRDRRAPRAVRDDVLGPNGRYARGLRRLG